MATVTVSIGSNSSIDTETPASSSGSGPSYVVTFGTTPSGISVGDIGFMDTEAAGGGSASDYTFLVTAISGSDITLKYIHDTGSKGDASPYGLYDGSGSSGSPNQAAMVFKRAYSTLTAFETDVDVDRSAITPGSFYYWDASDSIIAECHADSAFTDSRVYFNNKYSLGSITITVNSDDRHDGTANSGVVIRPTSGSGHNNAILDCNLDDLTIEWLEIDMGSLDSENTNKGIIFRGTCDNAIIRRNLIHSKDGNPGTTGQFAIHFTATASTSDNVYINNNIVYSFRETTGDSVSGINTGPCSATAYIYNNTVYNLETQANNYKAIGFRYTNNSAYTANVKNNIAALMTAPQASDAIGFFKGASGATTPANFNCTDDSITTSAYKAPGADSLQDKTLSEIDFVTSTPGSEDLHLDTSSVCRKAGTDLGTGQEVNIDIDGVDRDATGVTWDIGADQASTADTATGNPAFLMFMD